MNKIPENEGQYQKPNGVRPFELCIKNNFPFIENTYEALDTYGLLEGIVAKLNEVVSNLNVNEENIEFLNTNYEVLKNYVDNYFTNLDVQEEINQKLDEMATDGTLSSLIEKLLNYNENKLNYMLVNGQSPKILFAGDSIIEGQEADKNIPTYFKQLIKKIYNIDATILNKGLGGQTSSYGLANVQSYIDESPDIIFWEFGINDSNQNMPISATLSNLSQFYEKVSQAGIEMIVISAPLTYKQNSLVKTNYLMKQLNESIKNYCKHVGIRYVDLNKYIQKIYDTNSSYIAKEQVDGTHFSNYQLLSDILGVELLDSIYNVTRNIETYTPFKKGNYLETSGTNTFYQFDFALGSNLYFENMNNLVFKYRFFVSQDTRIKLLLYVNNRNGELTFKIDNETYTINANATVSKPNVAYELPIKIEPGIHEIELTNYTAKSSNPACYIEGVIFKSIINLSAVVDSPIFKGSISGSSENNVLTGLLKFSDCKKIKLLFQNNDYYYTTEVETTYQKNIIILPNGQAGNIIFLNDTTFNITNSSNYNLVSISKID